MSSSSKSDFSCCPEFNPVPWDDQTFIWKERQFIKDKVKTLFYMPLNFGMVMKKLDRMVTSADAIMPDWMCLSDHTSKWNMDIYLAVDKEISDCENVKLSGTYYCKVYEGPFKNTGIWSKDFEAKAQGKGYSVKKWYMWYTTCPKCAKKYGKNYVVIVGQV